MQSNTKDTNYKPRILMIGDSINRNAIKAYCKSVNSLAHEYTSCHGHGAHHACINDQVELTTFFIFGSALHEWSGQNELLRSQHLCSNMSHGTINRIRYHLLPSVKNVYGNNTIDIITINAIQWTLNDLPDKMNTFSTSEFSTFAHEYIHNMTIIIKEVRILFPTSAILLQTVPYSQPFQPYVPKVNKLIELIAAKHSNIGVYDVDNMCNGYLGQVIADDQLHPTPPISIAFVQLLIDIAYNMRHA